MEATQPAAVLQKLLRFDTSNPPGHERRCIDWIEGLLQAEGLETRRIARDPERPNLITRLPGKGDEPPLLFYGHVDVVPADPENWRHPPFGGVLEDGWVWGRGALDMKGGVAMLVSALIRARRQGVEPAGDILLAILVDEESGGEDGARFLTAEHPEVFEGVRWAIGEFGGFPLHLDGQKFYPIQMTEKGVCWLEARIRGHGGHGSFPRSGGTLARLGEMLLALDQRDAPHRVTPPVRAMLEAMAEAADPPLDEVFTNLLNRDRKPQALETLGKEGLLFEAVLQNTANATVVRAGDKVNVVPGEARVKIDGRTLPGQDAGDLKDELRSAVGEDVGFEVLRHDTVGGETDFSLFPLLGRLLEEADPDARPVPLVLLGGTDGRFFQRIGIQTYGFLPLNLPQDFDFLSTVHSVDERVPVSALEFGTSILERLILRYPG